MQAPSAMRGVHVATALVALTAACRGAYRADVEDICAAKGDPPAHLRTEEGRKLWQFFPNHGKAENIAKLRGEAASVGLKQCAAVDGWEQPAAVAGNAAPSASTSAKAGDTCPAGADRFCGDARTMLRCVKGKLAALPCHGPDGCVTMGAFCDQSIAEEGADCLDDFACAGDHKTLLKCDFKTNRFLRLAECVGPKGCTSTFDLDAVRFPSCDGRGVDGMRCKEEGTKACSPEDDAVLACKKPEGQAWATWSVEQTCDGKAKCKSGAKGMECAN